MILNNNYGKLLGSYLQIFENVRKNISNHMLVMHSHNSPDLSRVSSLKI